MDKSNLPREIIFENQFKNAVFFPIIIVTIIINLLTINTILSNPSFLAFNLIIILFIILLFPKKTKIIYKKADKKYVVKTIYLYFFENEVLETKLKPLMSIEYSNLLRSSGRGKCFLVINNKRIFLTNTSYSARPVQMDFGNFPSDTISVQDIRIISRKLDLDLKEN